MIGNLPGSGAPFILACGRGPACHSGVSNACAETVVPGFGSPGACAEYVAVPLDHNLAHLPGTISPALAAGLAAVLGCRVTTACTGHLFQSLSCKGHRNMRVCIYRQSRAPPQDGGFFMRD